MNTDAWLSRVEALVYGLAWGTPRARLLLEGRRTLEEREAER